MAEDTVTRIQFEAFKRDVEAAYNRLQNQIDELKKEIGGLRSQLGQRR